MQNPSIRCRKCIDSNCIRCPNSVADCERCSSKNNPDPLVDSTQDYFISLNQKSCLLTCPLKQFKDASDLERLTCRECIQFCDVCTNNLSCSVCTPGYVLTLDGLCAATCLEQSYKSGNICLACVSNCKVCRNDKICDLCMPTFHIERETGLCVSCNTSDGHFISENIFCNKCHASCLTCSGPESSQCLSCRQGFTLQEKKKTCLDDSLPRIKVMSTSFNPNTNEIKIVFDRKVSALNIASLYEYELLNETGGKVGFAERTSMKFADGMTAVTMRINFKEDVKNGKFILKPKTSQNSEMVNVLFDSSNSNLTYEEPIEVPIPETKSVSMQKTMDNIGNVSGPVMQSATTFTMLLSFTSAVALLKIFQMMDYMVLFSVVQPDNFRKFVEILTSNIFDYIPNVFKGLADDDCGEIKPKFAENEMSCQFISNSGNLFFLIIIILGIKLVIILVKATSSSPAGVAKSWINLKFTKFNESMGYEFFINFMDMF